MDIMKKEILKQVLLNAVQYNGKADVGAVVGKIIAENPKIKNEIYFHQNQVNILIWDMQKQLL